MEEEKKEETQNTEAPKTEGTQGNWNIMAIISYIGPLCLVPILTKEKDEFVKFHAKQGLVLLILEVAAWIVFNVVIWPLWFIGNILALLWIVLSIIGIINVTKNKTQEIPVVGRFAEKIKI